jgi:acetyltransferase-like isoleucine patch superfamily enzyme
MILLKLIKKGLSLFYTYLVKRKVKKYGSQIRVNSLSFVSKTTTLGKNVSFNGIQISGCGNVIIGNNFHSGKDCLIISQNHNFNTGRKIPYDDTYICKDIAIEDNVWLGDRVIILGGVTIGEGAIIQAGSVVVSNIPKYAIAGGHPAKVFSNRDIEHYKKLKQENKFH